MKTLQATGELIFVKNPDRRNKKGSLVELGKVFGRWEGGDIVEVSAPMLREMRYSNNSEFRLIRKNVYEITCMKQRVRVVGMRTEVGAAFDKFFLMRDGWQARLLWWRFSASLSLVGGIAVLEARIRQMRGERVEGQIMPIAARIATRLFPLNHA